MAEPRFNPEVEDGMDIPKSCFTATGRGMYGLDEARMLRWICPDLTYAEAEQIAEDPSTKGLEIKVATMQDLIRRHWPEVMEARRQWVR